MKFRRKLLYKLISRLIPCLILQAAAYGLPVVATKNGGPVDILKVGVSNKYLALSMPGSVVPLATPFNKFLNTMFHAT